jgi:hypothetical protein
MVRTKLSDLGFQRRRVRLVLTGQEWAILEDEADRRAVSVGTAISVILGLTIAHRDTVETITSQVNEDAALRSPGAVQL